MGFVGDFAVVKEQVKVFSFLDSDERKVFRKACRFQRRNPTQRGLQPEDWKGQWPSQQKNVKKRQVSKWIMKSKGSELTNSTGHS